MDLESLKYPIGKYHYSKPDKEQLLGWIKTIQYLPEELRKLVGTLSYEEMDLLYRPEGWNIKQVVHHLADSHMNSFIRFKLVFTEQKPILKPYNEADWAETEDANSEDIQDSLDLLGGLHKRWTTLLSSFRDEDFRKMYTHPEYNEQKTMEWMLGMYDWHCRHHLAHIKQAIELKGEFEVYKNPAK